MSFNSWDDQAYKKNKTQQAKDKVEQRIMTKKNEKKRKEKKIRDCYRRRKRQAPTTTGANFPQAREDL